MLVLPSSTITSEFLLQLPYGHFLFIILKQCARRHMIGIFGRQIDPLQWIHLQTKTQYRKNEGICPFEPASPKFQQSKTGNPITNVAIVIGFTSSSSCHIHRYANFFQSIILVPFPRCFQFNPYLFTSINFQIPVISFFFIISFS
jgi:hypothetical protein